MVAKPVAWLHTEVDAMVENERKKDLALIYPLLRPLPSGLAHFVQKFTDHITREGLRAINSSQADNVSFFNFMSNLLNACAVPQEH